MLSTRVKAFQKLDLNHDNLLSFEEWAVKTSNRFKEIDRNGDGILSRAELNAYYAAQDAQKAERSRAKSAQCACGKPGRKRMGMMTRIKSPTIQGRMAGRMPRNRPGNAAARFSMADPKREGSRCDRIQTSPAFARQGCVPNF
jgi:hypothetical protein